MTELTKAEQTEAFRILMNVPGLTFTVRPERDSQNVDGLLLALREASKELSRLYKSAEDQRLLITQTERDLLGLRRILGVGQ